MEVSENFLDTIAVCRHIIKVDHNTNIQKIKEMSFINCWKMAKALVRLKNIINYSKRPITSLESSLPVVIFKYINKMIYIIKIYLGIYPDFTE